MRLCGQAVGAGCGGGPPAVQRGAADAQDASDEGGGLSLLHQLDGASAFSFEFLCGSNGSHLINTRELRDLFLSLCGSQ